MRSPGGRAIGIACGAASVLLFSAFTLTSRLGLKTALTPADVAALRFGLGGTLLLPVFLRHGFAGLRWRDASALALFGGVGFASLAYSGFALAPAAHGAVLLHGTLPMTTAMILKLSGRARGGPKFGLCLIALGVGITIYGSVARMRASEAIGDLCLLLASASWSAYGVLASRLNLRPIRSAAIVAVLSMACVVPVYFAMPHGAWPMTNAHDWLVQAVVQGVLIGTVSIFVYTRAVSVLGPETMSLFTAAVPAITTSIAALFLAEAPSLADWAGVSAVTAGMVFSIPKRPATRQLINEETT